MRPRANPWVIGVTTCFLAGLVPVALFAQGTVSSIAFRNELKTPVIIQGISQIKGMVRRGQPVLIPVGRTNGDFNVPPGLRIYSVYDANQPSRVLAKDVPVNVVPGRNLSFAIRAVSATQVALLPD